MCFAVAKPTVHDSISQACDVVLKILPFPGLPRTEKQSLEVAARFVNSRGLENPLDRFCGALNGILIKVTKPVEVGDPGQYWNRKGYYEVPVQAVVDSDYRFRYMPATFVGSTRNALAFSAS